MLLLKNWILTAESYNEAQALNNNKFVCFSVINDKVRSYSTENSPIYPYIITEYYSQHIKHEYQE